MWEISIPFIIFGIIYMLAGLRVIKQWEKALTFTLGKYKGLRGAGLTWIMPGIQEIHRIDMRVRTLDVRP
jgi:regulator of protease activity HflC (stomatin/prohibitin superfamily)